ncbi:MAG TPA: DUF4830 domain-containing protein [Candidatus Monoglobus merdigallinarum]|uniref:DUF4830 domain-containing protein n=1 Tax=Candidatus Monoglobus merdigallinarum TaxID=2838698 RepID=A0A9D1TLZ4_9FIRM|nr:DUF4830 domain-containing protein [Candidatus Monoglobus merdigallinarum]
MKKFLRAYKYKIIFIIIAALLIAVIFALFSVDSATNSKNIEFIKSYGWETEGSPSDISHITLPETLTGIYASYAQISAVNGYSLSDYCGKSLTKYSYPVLNHNLSETGRVRANVLLYKSDIVAADISLLTDGGSTVPISDTSEIQP